jgi:hypothetical protein
MKDLISNPFGATCLIVKLSLLYLCRGAVSGKLYIKDGPMNPWQDCSTAGNCSGVITSYDSGLK